MLYKDLLEPVFWMCYIEQWNNNTVTLNLKHNQQFFMEKSTHSQKTKINFDSACKVDYY